MYFEEAEVKEYHRKNKEGKKTPYYQIRLKKGSKFSGVNEVALVDISEIKSVLKEYDVNKISELKKELKDLKKENQNLKEDKSKLQQKLINCNEEKDKLNEKLNNEKDLAKYLLTVRADFLKLNLLDRIRNKEPDSSKYLTKFNLPEDIDVQNE